jgi:nitrogenase-associated protein
MAKVDFYEKPGCAGNARQKALLAEFGHEVRSQSLLAAPWTPATLRPYFGARPVREWFNRAAPRVKSGEINPDSIAPEAALAAMIADPLLIRRPLMKVGDRCEAGFDQDLVAAWIGLPSRQHGVSEACVRPLVAQGSQNCTGRDRVRRHG